MAGGVVVAILIWTLVAIALFVLAGGWSYCAVRGIVRMVPGQGGAVSSALAMIAGILRFGSAWGMAALLFPPGLLIALPDIAALPSPRKSPPTP